MFCLAIHLRIWPEGIISASFVGGFFSCLWFELFPSLARVFPSAVVFNLARFLEVVAIVVSLQRNQTTQTHWLLMVQKIQIQSQACESWLPAIPIVFLNNRSISPF